MENELMDYTLTSQVHNNHLTEQCPANLNITGLRSIQPVAAQILSVANSNDWPLHIELDSMATVSYIALAEAKNCRYKIKPNNQISHLGDGLTPLKSYGEINVILYRNKHLLRFRALVAQHLHYTAIGGTTFIWDNNIKQEFNNNIIHLLGNTCIVPSTRREAILPVLQMSAVPCLHCSNLQMPTTHLPETKQHTTNSSTIPSTVQYGTAHNSTSNNTVHRMMGNSTVHTYNPQYST